MNEMTLLNEDQQYELMKKQAGALFKSRLFSDLDSYEKTVAKVMIGKEMGIGPFASIKGIYITKNGKAELMANLMAGVICNHARFAYRVKTSTKELCEIEFYDSSFGKSPVGTSSFSIQEAQQANLLGKDNWKHYPSDMLFARALSRGARRFCPGAFGGIPVYVTGEVSNDTIFEYDTDGVVNLSKDAIAVNAVVNHQAFSDEAIIEEFKQTNVINEEFR